MEIMADFFGKVWPLVAAVLGAPAVWLVSNFIGRPARGFFDLRRESKQLTLLLWDAPEYSRQSHEEWLEQMSALKVTRDRLTNVAAELLAFAQSETLAAWFVRKMGYGPSGAAKAAKTVAFELGSNIEDRDKNYRNLDTALLFRFDASRPFYDPYHPEPWKKPRPRKPERPDVPVQ